ncbi:MAG: S24/S26 family peptidase, partial [Ruminococcus sp.]|nr:S24/S26 family peptidase [Ruminococcus sp.]
MNKEVSMDDIIGILTEKLESGGTVTFTPRGKSMLPMLRDGEDVVVLSKPQGRLHLFDVPLYRRSNGLYVLHRIVDFDADGSYVMCGDNQFEIERGINKEQIIGYVSVIY